MSNIKALWKILTPFAELELLIKSVHLFTHPLTHILSAYSLSYIVSGAEEQLL